MASRLRRGVGVAFPRTQGWFGGGFGFPKADSGKHALSVIGGGIRLLEPEGEGGLGGEGSIAAGG